VGLFFGLFFVFFGGCGFPFSFFFFSGCWGLGVFGVLSGGWCVGFVCCGGVLFPGGGVNFFISVH